jgi:hypothetical protein
MIEFEESEEKEDKDDSVDLDVKLDFDPEIEDKVKYFMSLIDDIPDLPTNTKKYIRTKRPVFNTEYEKKEWEREEIRRCKHGYDGMCGKMYFWFNYCYIKNLKGGRIHPEFRVCDGEWFRLLERCQFGDYLGWGAICVKRRRGGFSWKEAADIMHDATFSAHTDIGMNSKSERDTIVLFNKVKFIYDNLPSFLRASTEAGKSKMSMFFGFKSKDANGNTIMRGTQSHITCVPPTDSAYEGMMLAKWICDEAGKIGNLRQMWSYTEECLMQETERVGVPVIFGTSGEIGKNGDGLMEMWYKSDLYKLKRFFFPGWMGLKVDEFGNDRKEDCIRWILYRRKVKIQMSMKDYNDYLQKYPLTPQEAFMQLSGGGVGDPAKINKQMGILEDGGFKVWIGSFKYSDEDGVTFMVHPNGDCRIYEHPDQDYKDLYLAGCDPADHDDATKEASDMATYIMKKIKGLEGPRIVFEYVARPKKAADYYEQVLMACIYYKCKILIERNRYRMISYLEEAGYKHLLVSEPSSYLKRSSQPSRERIGVTMTEATRQYMKDLIEAYIDDYCDSIPSVPLLKEFLLFGSRNTDRAFAFGMCLIYEKENKTIAKKFDEIKPNIPRFSYKRINGEIRRVSG